MVMEKVLMALATDARGETVARFCGYVGAELAVRDPTRLVSYLGPPANADYLASLCSKHIHLPEVWNMIEACCMDSLATNEAVKRFLLSLHDAIIHLTNAQDYFRLEHLQLLCRLTAEKQLSSLRSAFPDCHVTERIIMMVKRTDTELMPLPVLSEVASVCRRRQLKEIESIVFERAEKLISLGCIDAKRIREHDAVEIKCMRRLIHLLKNRSDDSKLPRATDDAQPTMPAMLMQLSELTLDSTKFVDLGAEPTSDRGVMACEAAELLSSSVGYLWSREEVTQCATFSERDWHECVQMLEERRTDPSKRALAILRLAKALRPPPLSAPPPPLSAPSTPPPAELRGVDAAIRVIQSLTAKLREWF
jgi:hypothetical protein